MELSYDPKRKPIETKTGLRFWGYKSRRELASESVIDEQTGLLNRRGWEKKNSGLKGASFIVIDLDDLKLTNDTKGHHVGDKLITGLADILRAITRTSDIAARIGGDEFALCLPRTKMLEAENLKNRLIEAAYNAKIKISIGIGANLQIADEEMYKMKREHKNG